MELDPTLVTWAFFIGGLLLMLLETLIPGGITFFLGIGGLTVAGLRVVGLVEDPLIALGAWLFLSAGLTIALRPVLLKYLRGDSFVGLTDEDAEAMGQRVTVVEPVGEETTGRIRFRGATWDAQTLEGRLPKGADAVILYRDNLTWIVESADPGASSSSVGDVLDTDALEDAGTSARNEQNRTRS